MSESLRILMLEDNPVDAELNERALRAGGLTFQARRVEGRAFAEGCRESTQSGEKRH